MNRISHIVVIVISSLSFSTQAASYKFDNIDSGNMKNLTRDFSANFMHTTVSAASSLGEIFGLEFGIVGGMTNTNKLATLAHEIDPDLKADRAYFGAAMAQISVPLGFTIEGTLLPKVGSEDFKFGTFGLGAKWTLTDTVLADFPVSLALRAHITKSNAEIHQEISSVKSDLEFENLQQGVAVVVSKNLAIVEPYVTLGFARTSGELKGAMIFNDDLAGSTSATAKDSSAYYGVGVELKLLIIRAGAEYTHLYDTSRVAGKVSFYF